MRGGGGVIFAEKHLFMTACKLHLTGIHRKIQLSSFIGHLLLLATFAGPVNFKLWKTDKTFRLLILNRMTNSVYYHKCAHCDSIVTLWRFKSTWTISHHSKSETTFLANVRGSYVQVTLLVSLSGTQQMAVTAFYLHCVCAELTSSIMLAALCIELNSNVSMLTCLKRQW